MFIQKNSLFNLSNVLKHKYFSNTEEFTVEQNYNEYYFKLARTALVAGFKTLNIQAGSIVLLPEYICDVVPLEVKTAKINIRYYKVTKNLKPDIDSILENIANVKAILVVNYFGIYNQVHELKEIANKHNVFVIEDNAHGFGSKYKNQLLGTIGHIGISSPRKTLPIISGGILYANSYKYNNLLNIHDNTDNYVVVYIKQIIKKLLFSFTKYKKFYPEYSNPYKFKEDLVIHENIDSFSKKYIQNFQHVYLSKRLKLYYIWQRFALQNGVELVFEHVDEETVPMAFVGYAKDRNERDKWLEWGRKNNMDVYTWPRLPDEMIDVNKDVYHIWEKLVCFPINLEIDEKNLETILKENNGI